LNNLIGIFKEDWEKIKNIEQRILKHLNLEEYSIFYKNELEKFVLALKNENIENVNKYGVLDTIDKKYYFKNLNLFNEIMCILYRIFEAYYVIGSGFDPGHKKQVDIRIDMLYIYYLLLKIKRKNNVDNFKVIEIDDLKNLDLFDSEKNPLIFKLVKNEKNIELIKKYIDSEKDSKKYISWYFNNNYKVKFRIILRLLKNLLEDIGFDLLKMNPKLYNLSNYYIDLLSEEDRKIILDERIAEAEVIDEEINEAIKEEKKEVVLNEDKGTKEEQLYKQKYLKYPMNKYYKKYLKYKQKYLTLKNKLKF
jgi:hypothetical protein